MNIETALERMYKVADMKVKASEQTKTIESELQKSMEETVEKLELQLQDVCLPLQGIVGKKQRQENIAVISLHEIQSSVLHGKLKESKIAEYKNCEKAHGCSLIHSIPEDNFSLKAGMVIDVNYMGLIPKVMRCLMNKYKRKVEKEGSEEQARVFAKMAQQLVAAVINHTIEMQQVIAYLLKNKVDCLLAKGWKENERKTDSNTNDAMVVANLCNGDDESEEM